MNKMLQFASTGNISVTNDDTTILKSIQLDNTAAKILVNISKVQDDERVCVCSGVVEEGGEDGWGEGAFADGGGGV
jgi:hypothetical protein